MSLIINTKISQLTAQILVTRSSIKFQTTFNDISAKI